MLYKGLKTIVDKDTYYIIICSGDIWTGMSEKGTTIETSNDVWTFDTEEEQLEKLKDLENQF
jgi:hypothetical protein